jgi:hypothetical protein
MQSVDVVAALLSQKGQAGLCLFQNIYSVGSTFIASVSADVFETDRKSLMVRAQQFFY